MEKIRNEFEIDALYNHNIRGAGVGVAVFDTGIYSRHPDLMGSVIGYYDAVYHRSGLYDDHGHGTHVAGIIGGRGAAMRGKYRGIAPKVNLISVKVLNRMGKGRIQDVLEGIFWVLENAQKYNIRIVNMSIGMSEKSEESELVKNVELLWDAGIIVVAAAGNNGPDKNSISAPGISRKIITVGSYDDDREIHIGENNKMIHYSGRGPTQACIIKPEVLAPGYEIISCAANGKLYEPKSGTSMATPIVTGLCALVVGEYPQITPKEIKKMLHDSAIDMGFSKHRQGWGKVNLQKFLLRD